MGPRLKNLAVIRILALLSLNHQSHADPLDQWTWRFPVPQANTLRAVTYGNGRFVAVGDRGTIITSEDAYHWTNETPGTFPNLHGVAYASGVYVAVGDSGTILTSYNGVNWSQAASPTTNTLWAIAANPSASMSSARFAAVGDNGTEVYSADSVSWFNEVTGTRNNLRSITFDPTGYAGYAAVGDNGALVLNESFYLDLLITNDLRCISIGNGVYAIGGELVSQKPPDYTLLNSILYSFDTWYWNQQTFTNGIGLKWPGLSQWFYLNGMAFGGGLFVAVGDTGQTLEYAYPGVLFTSGSGTNWTQLPIYTSENSLYGVAYGAGNFVAVGGAGAVLVSPNGTNWVEATGYHRSVITAMACSDKLSIASGTPAVRFGLHFPDFTSLVSSNALDWIPSSTNLPGMNDLVASEGLFVGVSGGCIYTTTDGSNWANNCISSNTLRGAATASRRFVVVGDGGAIFASEDGLSWSNYSLATTANFNSVSYGNGLFVAGGTGGAVSHDSISWSLNPTNPPITLTQIIYANGAFLAAGRPSYGLYTNVCLLTSENGVEWRLRYSLMGQVDFLVPCVAYANGEFLAISGVTLLKSPDGINWKISPTTLPQLTSDWFIYYYNRPAPIIRAYQGKFLVAGMDGIIMSSSETRIPIVSSSPQASAGGFTFSFSPQLGQPYRIQATTNLTLWDNVYAGISASLLTTFTDPGISATSKRFFRVISP